jgi:hypothetical protein
VEGATASGAPEPTNVSFPQVYQLTAAFVPVTVTERLELAYRGIHWGFAVGCDANAAGTQAGSFVILGEGTDWLGGATARRGAAE